MTDTPETIDFSDTGIQTCPFPAYAKIKEMGGVYLDKKTGFFVVTDYNLVRKLALDNKRLSNQAQIIGVRNDPWQDEVNAIYAERGVQMHNVLVSADPPQHTFQRSLVDKVFSPARVAQMADYLQGIVDTYIDAFIDERAVDFHTALSVMMPITVIADQLGVSHAPEDLAKFKTWSDSLARSSEPIVSREDQIRYANDICDLQQFILGAAEKYRQTPGNCMLSDLIHTEVDGRRLSRDELVSMVMIILAAGHETTTTAISNGMLRLLDDLELQSRLRANPGLIPKFVEEVLRIDSPIQGLFRRTLEDMHLGELDVPAGSILVLKWGGANHDPDKFACPEKMDIERTNATQHVAFGFGPHFCVGNQLARSELRIIFERMLERTKEIRHADRPDNVVRQPHFITYGLKHLQIEFDRA